MGITVGQLVKELQYQNPDDEVVFGPKGHFSYSRTKDRGGEVQIEFNEICNIHYDLLPEHPLEIESLPSIVYEESSIWGAGCTERVAVENAKEDYSSNGWNFEIAYKAGKLKVAKAAPSLVDYVEEHGGGDVKWGFNENQVAVLSEW
ncbi:hypothetical protein CWB99_11655 [Pseudoalteromonas rubra]|uniref:Uncharacterized protein n=1 Tax=Pseudoalteromonas rubra TaxID=43658 RepID=A0A5S3WLF3_9GAMM|nr:hypothetical protein [Pseudoalteromonas rubra]TMP28561.1 hypothetical protein CWB99_11655 [Pseudoalteromonas rubra]TMP30527.1 hypothetical protein CWC00_16770 [Pseudoalteromonas rubra]